MNIHEICEKIKEENDLLEEVSKSIKLKHSGNGYVGLCPFHSEKSPSFRIKDGAKFYKCFGCGASGSIIDFIMNRDNKLFSEVISSFGYNVNKNDKETSDYTIVRSLLDFSHESESYLYLKGRGFSDSIIARFNICSFLKTNSYKYSNSEILDCKKRLGLKDSMKDRYLFPIFSEYNNIIGFGARKNNNLDSNKSIAKYINSDQSELYNKSQVLYGLNIAKHSILNQKNAFVVEGYTDVMAMHQLGYSHTVGKCGTALTDYHCRLLKAYTNKVVLLYDNDSSGLKPLQKDIETCFVHGLIPHIGQFNHLLTDKKAGESKFDPCDLLKCNDKTIVIKSVSEYFGKTTDASELLERSYLHTSDKVTKEIISDMYCTLFNTDKVIISQSVLNSKVKRDVKPIEEINYTTIDMLCNAISKECIDGKYTKEEINKAFTKAKEKYGMRFPIKLLEQIRSNTYQENIPQQDFDSYNERTFRNIYMAKSILRHLPVNTFHEINEGVKKIILICRKITDNNIPLQYLQSLLLNYLCKKSITQHDK